MRYSRVVASLLVATVAPFAAAQAAAPAAQAASAAPSSPAKKALAAKVLKLQQAGIENLARQITEQPAMQLLQRADMALQRVPAERREQLARDIQGDARKYADETVPIVRERAVALAPQTIGPILEANFSEDELKQIAAILESPVNRKFQQLSGEMQRALAEKLVGETRTSVEPKLQQFEQSLAKRFEAAASAAAAASGAASGPKR